MNDIKLDIKYIEKNPFKRINIFRNIKIFGMQSTFYWDFVTFNWLKGSITNI